MNTPGRPNKDDEAALLGMAKIICGDCRVSPTFAFREVYPTLQGEQSGDASRVRLLRKFKKQRPRLMAEAQQLLLQELRPRVDPIRQIAHASRSLEAMQTQLNAYPSFEAMMQVSRQIEKTTANPKLTKFAQKIQNVIKGDIYAKTILAVELNNFGATIAKLLEHIATNDLKANAARLGENTIANKINQLSMEHVSQSRN